MYRVHRLGHIEANSIELSMSALAFRKARQAYSYMTLGFEMEVEKQIGIELEGVTRVALRFNPETLTETVLLTGDKQ